VNGKGDPIVATPEPDERQSTVVRLPDVMRIRTLDIAVTDRTSADHGRANVAFGR